MGRDNDFFSLIYVNFYSNKTNNTPSNILISNILWDNIRKISKMSSIKSKSEDPSQDLS